MHCTISYAEHPLTRIHHPNVFDTEDLQNGTVKAGLRSNPSSMATLETGNNRNNQLTGKELRSQFMEYFNNEGKVPWEATVYKEVLCHKPLLLIYLVYTLHILYE